MDRDLLFFSLLALSVAVLMIINGYKAVSENGFSLTTLFNLFAPIGRHKFGGLLMVIFGGMLGYIGAFLMLGAFGKA